MVEWCVLSFKEIFSAEFEFIVTYIKEEEREGLFSIRMYAYKKFNYLYIKFICIITRHGKVTSMSLAVRNGIHAISPLSMKYR